MRPNQTRSLLLLVSGLLTAVLLAGCGTSELLSNSTPIPGAAATAARAAATPIPTPARTVTANVQQTPGRPTPAATPAVTLLPADEDQRAMEAVVVNIGRALANQDLVQFEPLFLDEVAVASQELGGETLARERARAWLGDRLGPGIKVASWRSVEDYGLLEVVTGPWPKRPPLTEGRVTFNLHRFNGSGQQDAFQGEWKIDVIIAE